MLALVHWKSRSFLASLIEILCNIILKLFRLAVLDAHDRELAALSSAKNSLETFIYDIRDKLEHDVRYKKASTSDEQKKINAKLNEIDAWLDDEGINADVKVFHLVFISYVHCSRLLHRHSNRN